MPNRSIAQLVPALSGWLAVFADGDDEILTPVVAWALMDDGVVVGLVTQGTRVVPCDGERNFTGYAHAGDMLTDAMADDDEVDDEADFDFDDDGPGSFPPGPPRRTRLN